LAFQKHCPLLVAYDFSTEQKPNIYWYISSNS
jgi:hypothetical protein